jgi:hypothetical protein
VSFVLLLSLQNDLRMARSVTVDIDCDRQTCQMAGVPVDVNGKTGDIAAQSLGTDSGCIDLFKDLRFKFSVTRIGIGFADIAQKGYDAMLAGDVSSVSELVNANFDLRDKIFNVAEENRRMVMTARTSGASAKFAGSGGAIVGTYEDEEQFLKLEKALSLIGCKTIKPIIACDDTDYHQDEMIGVWRNS